MISRVGFVPVLLVGVLLLTACQPGTSNSTSTEQVAIVRQLATIGPTLTLNPAQRQATQQAALNVAAAQPTSAPTATPYVGVFLGEIEPEQPLVDPARFALPGSPAGAYPLACEIEPGDDFGMGWAGESRILNAMGCPIQIDFGFSGTVQVFQTGVMYLRPDTSEVWVVVPGPIHTGGSYWYIDRPAMINTEGIAGPPGQRIPEGVLGSVWVGTPEIRAVVGFAATPEQPVEVQIQRFEGGTLLMDKTVGQIFVLLVNGETYGPY